MSALKVLSLRLRGMKGQLQELGEETDENVENISKMQGQILNMTKGKVNIFDSTGNFKSTYEIMKGIAEVWDDLSSIDQADLLETIAGKNRANDVAALLSNWENVEAAVKSASEAEGSAARENAKYIDSIQGRLDKLSTAWQSFAQTFMSSDFAKGAVSALTDLVEILEKLVDNFGLLGITGLGTLGTGIFKYFTDFKETFESIDNIADIADIVDDVGDVGNAVKNTTDIVVDATGAIVDLGSATGKTTGVFKAFMKTPLGVASAIGIAIAAISLIYNHFKKLEEEAEAARQQAIDTADEFLDSASSFEQAYIKYSGKTNLTVEEEAELESAIKGTVDALDDKSSALQNIVNGSNDYVASLEAIKNAELDATKRAAEKKRDNAAESLRVMADKNLDGIYAGLGTATDHSLISGNSKEIQIAKEMGSDFLTKISTRNGYRYTFSPPADGDIDSIVKYYNTLIDYQSRLENAKLTDISAYSAVSNAIDKMSDNIAVYTEGVYEAIKAEYQLAEGIPKTIEDYVAMRESILNNSGLDNYSLEQKLTIANDLDSKYAQVFDLSSAKVQARKFVGLIKGYGDGTKDGTDEIGTVETFLNIKTAVNNNEVSVGKYLSQFDKVNEMTENWSNEEKELFNSSFGLDTDTIKQQYKEMQDYLARQVEIPSLALPDADGNFDMTKTIQDVERAKLNIDYFLDSLTADELEAVIDIRTEIDWQNTSAEDIRKQIEDQAAFIRAMNYTIAIDVETESIETLNTAMAESVSGVGLSSDSIEALKSRYSELASQGYDLSAMFEETSNGIHLNKNAISEFEQTLASNKLSETDKNLDVLKDRYDELTKEIETCTDAGKRASLYSEQQEVAQKINDLATLASQYKGLTSAYNAWQNAESAGSERDMYESIIEGFETVGDEISRGWYDDGTIKFLELLTGKTDLVGKSAKELKEIYNGLDKEIKNTSYSVRDFFTVDEDGNSTSAGAYNFLKALEQLEKSDTVSSVLGKQFKDIENIDKLVQRDADGRIVEFDFNVVGGDKAVADALGISEEMVQIMQRALDDAGFVVTLDGKYTLLADLKTSAEEASNALKKLKTEGLESLKDVDLNFDFNVDTVEGYQKQLEKATAVLDKFRDKNGKLKTDKNGNLVEGAKEALEIAEYYTAAMDKLTEPKIMQIDTSTVDEELQTPIEKIQEIGDLCKEKHLVALTGDTKELDKVQGEIDKVAKEIEELDPEVKAQIGIDEDWDAKTIADKIEKGEIEIPAELKLDVQMSEDLKDIRLLMMRQLGLVDDNEVKLKIGYDIDDSTVDKLIKDGKEKVIIEFITENEEWFDKLTDDKKKIVIDLVSNGVDLSSLEDEKKKVVIEYIEKDAEWFNKLDDEEKKVVVNYVAEHGEIDNWSPEAKEAFVKYLVDGGDPDKFDPDDKESWVVYKKDSTEPDSYAPRNPNALVKYGKDSSVPDTYDPKDPDATVKYGKNSLIPDNYIPLDPPATVIFDKDTSAVDSYDPPNFVRTVTYKVKEIVSKVAAGGKKKAAQRTGSDLSPVNGTANVNGTTGRAFKQGSWGTKNSGTALVGELGREVLVRDGRYYTIGDNGAEFIKYKKGDIIFNHVQSEQLFKNGKVTAGGGRAKAFVNGAAFTQGTAFSSGSGGGEEPEVTSYSVGEKPDSSDTENKFEDVIDWIETILDRAERAIDKYEQQANNVYKSWTERNKALNKEITEVGNTITLYEQAKNKYLSEANSVALSESYKTKVRNGSLSIEDFAGESDEKLVEKIKEYEEWINKAKDLEKQIEELKETEASLYSQRFENVQSEYDFILQGFDHTQTMLEEYINQSEEKGHIISKNYYKALIDNEENRIDTLKKERVKLLEERGKLEDHLISTGMTMDEVRDAAAWQEMCVEIDGVTQSIESAETATIEWGNAIDDIDLEIFDLIQQRISDITDEADFFVELMSNKKLFDDDGKLTSQGFATMGLHAQNYNTYMYQADLAGEEAERLKKKLEITPYDTNLEEDYREMIALQREYILAAEDSKNAIVDLVQEGIELEIDALDEKIQKYKDSLDSAKDLYDYQKRVEEQTENIAGLQKKLSAYQGFTDEETKAKVQQLKVELEEAEDELYETELDRYFSQQEALLDYLYTEYELILNERLDNVDFLLSQVIDTINAIGGTEGVITTALGSEGAIALALGEGVTGIKTTLETEAGKVGTTLSTAMSNIWTNDGSGKAILDLYGTDFQKKHTTTNDVLNSIKLDVARMVDDVDKDAQTQINAPETKPAAQQNPAPAPETKPTNNKNSEKEKLTDDQLMGIAASVWIYGNNSGWGNNPLRSQRLIDKFGADAAKKVQALINAHGANGDLYNFWVKKNYNLDKYKYSAFKLGAKKIDESQLAWTQEQGQEYIVRPSDGAILTPVAKGDSVLNAQASNNIWQMANNPAEFIKDNLNLGSTNVPNNSTVQNSYSQHIDNVVFRMDNVKNYDEMLTQMQRDPNFERLVTSMSIDRLAGKSSLAKGKAIR